jgi:molecular chaperone Hsp33
VQHYFNQSEQIGSGIKMSVGQRDGMWRAGGIMVQKMPEEGGYTEAQSNSNLHEDDWRRAMVLMDSCTEDEFLDPQLHSNVLLVRLFHDEGVRVFEPLAVQKNCRCSEDKVERVLAMMSDDDVEYMNKDGRILMRCEFCSFEYAFDFEAVKKERAQAAKD